MNSKMAYEKYKKTSIESASREKILLMLYEGAIKFTKRAIVACEQKDLAEKGINIGRAFDIINELNNTLDHKVGGELAGRLESLYNFITEQLTKANIATDPEPLKSVLKILETLYDGWVKAVEQLKHNNTLLHQITTNRKATMEKILILLDERNRYLTKFLLLTEEEEVKFRHGDFSGLDRFYASRESLLDMVKEVEKLVDGHLKENTDQDISDDLREGVQLSLKLRGELIKRILTKDLDILGQIEIAKSKIILELQAVGRSKKVITAYHSGIPAQLKMDEKV